MQTSSHLRASTSVQRVSVTIHYSRHSFALTNAPFYWSHFRQRSDTHDSPYNSSQQMLLLIGFLIVCHGLSIHMSILHIATPYSSFLIKPSSYTASSLGLFVFGTLNNLNLLHPLSFLSYFPVDIYICVELTTRTSPFRLLFHSIGRLSPSMVSLWGSHYAAFQFNLSLFIWRNTSNLYAAEHDLRGSKLVPDKSLADWVVHLLFRINFIALLAHDKGLWPLLDDWIRWSRDGTTCHQRGCGIF